MGKGKGGGLGAGLTEDERMLVTGEVVPIVADEDRVEHIVVIPCSAKRLW